MNYNQKPSGTGGGHGGGPPNGPNNQQMAKTLAGIQQQMQNLAPPADINAFLQQQRFQNMLQQHLQQMQMQNKDRGASGGGEPLALTRTPAAAELLNKTYQQQPNGSAGSSPALSPFHQQLPNIMQQLQAFQYQFQQHQQHLPQTQQPQHHTQPQQQPQPPLPAQHQQPQLHNQTHQQQQKALSTAAAAVQLQIQQNLQQRYILPGAQSTTQAPGGNKVNATTPPQLPNQMKPPNLPPSTQITPVPASTSATASGSAIKMQSAPSGSGISSAKQVPPSISLLPAKQASNPAPTAAHQQTKFVVGKSPPVVSTIPPPFPTHYQKSSPTGGASGSQAASNNATKGGAPEAAVASLKPLQVNPVPLTKPLPTTASNTVNMGVASSKVMQPTPAPTQSTNSVNAVEAQPQKATASTTATPPVTVAKTNKPSQVSDAAGAKIVDTTDSKCPIAPNPNPDGEVTASTLVTANMPKKISPPAGPMPIEAKTSSKDHTTKSTAPVAVKEHKTPDASSTVPTDVADKSATVPVVVAKVIDGPPAPALSSDASVASGEYKELASESKECSLVKSEDNKASKTRDINKNETAKSELSKTQVPKSDEPTETTKQADLTSPNAADHHDGNNVETKKVPSGPSLDKEKVVDEKHTNLKNADETNSNSLSTTHKEPIVDDAHPKDNSENTESSALSLEAEPIKEAIAKNNDKKEPTVEEPQKGSQEKPATKPKEEKTRTSKVEKAATKATTSTAATIAVVNESVVVSKVKTADTEVQPSPEPSVAKKAPRLVKVAKTAPAPQQALKEKTPDRSEKPSGSRASRGEKRKSKTETSDNSLKLTLTPSLPSTPKEANDSAIDRKSQRHRLKTILYQSPLPELAFITKLSASEASNSPKPMSVEDKLIVFYKNEYMAVRNAEGTFYLCQTMQNVYRSSPRISIRWLSEDAHDSSLYKPDFYDHTDIECVLTTVELKKVDKGHLRLPKAEKARIENILKKAIDVEKGLLPRPELTEENPDGLDISLYKDESQIEKKIPSGATPVSTSKGRKSRPSKSQEKLPKESFKRKGHPEAATANESSNKQSAKKRKSLTKRKKKSKKSTTSDDESTDDLESDSEYKPSQKKMSATSTSTPRVQRSPLARAKAASPTTTGTLRGDEEGQVTPTTSGRAERATKRKSAVGESLELPIPSKRPVPKQVVEENTSKSTNSRGKAQESSSHAVISSSTTAKKSQNHEISATSATATPSTSPAAATTSTLSSSRPTRSRK